MFAAILLFPTILLIPGHTGPSVSDKAGSINQPMQYANTCYPSLVACATTQYTSYSPVCDPSEYYQVYVTPQIQILSFALNGELFHPGDQVSFDGSITVSDSVTYANCLGWSYNSATPVSPSEANVDVAILGENLKFTPTNAGSFSGSIQIPLTAGDGTYSSTATATYQGAIDTKTASFTVEVYTPTLSIAYPSLETQAHPGDSILLEGAGWIPNSRVSVIVDDDFNVSTDSAGHFTLEIPISPDNPPSEGNHTITVEQENLVKTTSFLIRYRTLLLSLSEVSPIAQGLNATIQGNVTILETHQTVRDANVTIFFSGHRFALQTNQAGAFQTNVWIDPSTSPGMYTLSGNATKRGFRSSGLVTEEIKVMPASNVPVVASIAATGAVVGVAASLTIKKFSKPKIGSVSKSGPASIGPGTTSSTSTSIASGTAGPPSGIGPGAQTQPAIASGQQPTLGPGSTVKTQWDFGEIHVAPIPAPGGAEFCIHCGLEIRRGSTFCPECGLRLR